MIPINKNEEYKVTIIDMSYEGQGIAKIDGFTIFVKGAILDEVLQIKVLRVEKNHAFAKIEKIIKKSPNRVEVDCDIESKCGGCQLRYMSYEAQLDFKHLVVRQAFRKKGFDNIKIEKVIGMKDFLNYRNKVQFPVGFYNDEFVIGFYKNRSNEIVPVSECKIQNKMINKLGNLVVEFLNKYNIQGIKHIVIRVGVKTNQVMLIIVSKNKKVPNMNELVEYVNRKMKEVKTIILNINQSNTNVVMGEKNILLYGNGYIEDYIDKYKFRISPLSFYQVNPVQTEVLYNEALKCCELTKEDIVFDLYCGIGTISLFLSQNAQKVYGVEVVESAIEDAKINADENNINNTEFICGDVNKVLPELLCKNIKPDVVVIDPPRKGCDKEVLETIIKTKVKRIVYVSCNPISLASDVRILVDEGYEINKVQPVDMFAGTRHVECVILLTRRES